MRERTKGGRNRRARAGAVALLVLAPMLALGLAGCDSEDNDWEQPADPGPAGGEEPEPRAAPDLSIGVTVEAIAGDVVRSGDQVVYTVALSNDGDGPATAIVVAVGIPEGLTLDQTIAEPGEFARDTGLWSLAELTAKDEATLAIGATVGDGLVGSELELVVTVQSMQPEDALPADNVASVRFTVVNEPPQANDDAYTVAEGAILAVAPPGLLENDLDLEGEDLAVDDAAVADPAHGALTLTADGAFAYVHDGGEAVADSFRYRIVDASAEVDTAMVRLSITPVNDPPRLDAPASVVVAEGEGFAPLALDPLVDDPDHPDDVMQWYVLGASVLTATVSPDRVLAVAAPDADWFGSETLRLRVKDPGHAIDEADVVFEVTSVNDPPVISGLPSQSVPVGADFLPVPLDSYVSDVDHDNADLEWTYRGEEPLQVTISAARVLTVQPPNDTWIGGVTFTLRATDPAGGWDERTCRYEITPAR